MHPGLTLGKDVTTTMREDAQAAKSVGKVILATLSSKALGFLRETFIAAVFGASRVTDAYLVAAAIPGMLFSGFQNALQITVVPVFTEVLTNRGRKAAFAMVNSLANLMLLICLGVTAIGVLLLPWIVRLLAPGFSVETQKLTVYLAEIMFPLVGFWALTGIMSGVLNTFNRFTLPSLIGVPYNLIIIISLYTLCRAFGIYGLAWGTLAAVAGQLLFLLPGYLGQGASFSLRLDIHDPGVAKIVRMSVPVLLSAIVTQVMAVVDRVLGSGLPAGSIAALAFAERINALALGLVATSISTVMFPLLAKHAATGEWEEFKSKAARGVTIVSFIVLPLASIMLCLAEPIVQLIYQHGAFEARATALTSVALRYYALGTLAVAVRIYLEKVFYSLKDSLTPMILGAVSLGSNIIFSVVLVRYLAHGGLALGASLAQCEYILAALVILVRRKVLGGKALLAAVGKLLLAVSGMTSVILWAGGMIKPWFSPGAMGQGAYLVLLGSAGFAIYLALGLLLRSDEPLWLWSFAAGRSRNNGSPEGD